jgi:hypothetical protein
LKERGGGGRERERDMDNEVRKLLIKKEDIA